MRSRVSAGRASTTAFRAMAPPSSLIANRVSMLSSPSIEKRRALPDAPAFFAIRNPEPSAALLQTPSSAPRPDRFRDCAASCGTWCTDCR